MPRAYGTTNAAPYASAPAVGATGDNYWNTTDKALYQSDGAAWLKIGPAAGGAAVTIGPSAPALPNPGDLWWRNDPDGNLYVYYNDGTSTQWVPATSSVGGPWIVSGATLTPSDATKTVAVPGPTAAGDQTCVQFGSRTQKGRLTMLGASDVVLLTKNVKHTGAAWVRDDTAQPAWIGNFSAADTFQIERIAAAGTQATLLTLDSAAHLTLAGTLTTGGVATPPSLGGVRVGGTQAGVRYQNVGTATADGFSNCIGFGWDGTVKCRVDATQVGTVTITSDERVKLDAREDVPGLDALCALRPISFEYDQTKRDIGFPQGRQYGLVAQEAQAFVPLVVEEEGEFLAIDYRKLVPVLIQAIRELRAEVRRGRA